MLRVLAQAGANGADGADWLGRILTFVGAVVGFVTAAVTYANSRRVKPYLTTAGSNLATVMKIEAPEPQQWRDKKFPEDWPSEETRRNYWRKMRRDSLWAYWISLVIWWLSFMAFIVNFLDMAPIWLFYAILAIPYWVGAMRRAGSLRGEPWKELTLRGKQAKLTMAGSRNQVLSRCLSALHAIGGLVIDYDADDGKIIGATGREAWWYTPERVEVYVRPAGNNRFEVSISSDDPTPAPAAFLKPNLANVRRLVAELSASGPESEPTVEVPESESAELTATTS